MPSCHFWTAPSREHAELLLLSICMFPRGLLHVFPPSLWYTAQEPGEESSTLLLFILSSLSKTWFLSLFDQPGPQPSLLRESRSSKWNLLSFHSVDMIDWSILHLFRWEWIPCHVNLWWSQNIDVTFFYPQDIRYHVTIVAINTNSIQETRTNKQTYKW